MVERQSELTTMHPPPKSGGHFVRLVENVGSFETGDGTVWCGGYAPIDSDGQVLATEEHVTTDPRCFWCSVAGVSYRHAALQHEGLGPGAQLVLKAEPHNNHDPNAIGVWDPARNAQLGYLPRDLARAVVAHLGRGQNAADVLGAVVIAEYRRGSRDGPRVGLRILVGPTGELDLRVSASDDERDGEAFRSAVEALGARSSAPLTPASGTSVSCPACGSHERVLAGAGGFRCSACQRDVWIIKCNRCRHACVFFGSAAGKGALEFKCTNCRRRNIVEKEKLREIAILAKRMATAETTARRQAASSAAEQERLAHAQRTADLQSKAERQNRALQAELEALQSLLSGAIETRRAFNFAALKVDSVPPTFSPGALADEETAPRLESFLPPSATGITAKLRSQRRKQQALVDAAHTAFELAEAQHARRDEERRAALDAYRADFEAKRKQAEEATRRQHDEVDELECRYCEGASDAVTEFLGAAIGAMPLPFIPPKPPRVAYSRESKQLVVELELPTLDVIPAAREYRYIKSRHEISTVPNPEKARRALYQSVISQGALAVIHSVFSADRYNVVETVVLNGHVQTIDPRTGQSIHPCLLTVRTTRDRFMALNLRG